MAGLTLDAFHLEVQPLTEMAAVALALRQAAHAPLPRSPLRRTTPRRASPASWRDRSSVRVRSGFSFNAATAMALSFGESLWLCILSVSGHREQIWNAT